MNKKTFVLALALLCTTLAWLGVCLYWRFAEPASIGGFDLAIALFFVAVAAAMTVHEFRKKKRVHLEEANKHQSP